LSIVDFIVRAHGGAVAVESGLGAGSRFRVSLPWRRPQGAAA
jgi:signal transduction histidine kinase